MDLKGFETITETVRGVASGALVTPKPNEGESVRFVTVESSRLIAPAMILNALADAGIMHYEGARQAMVSYSPELNPLGVQPGSITFEDMNARGSW